jgi:phospholipid/cholesterol/gamma-HCH transport system substrate-binding protein
MKNSSVEIAVGIFVIIGMLCVGYLTVKMGKLEWFGSDLYPVVARFQSISGLKTGANVEMAGVEIGKVESIDLDLERQVAVVTMRIQKRIELSEDVIASIKTAGIIGDKYIKLTPGGSDELLGPGDMIEETQSAVDIEELISKYVFGGA